MKKKIIIILAVIFYANLQSQTLDDKMGEISIKIAKDLRIKKDYVIAIYPFTSLKKKESNLSLHIFEELHTSLKAKEYNFKLMDRGTLDSYLAEHQLNSNRLIDKKTAKDFGKLIAADAYVTGKVYVFGSVINLTIKLTDTETGEIISFNSTKIPIDYDMSQFLEIKNWDDKKAKANVNKSQNPDCNSRNIGNHCFSNNSGIPTKVVIRSGGNYNSKKELVIPYETDGCFKDLKVGSYTFEVYRIDRINIVGSSNIISKGNFTIEKCSSKLQKITNKPIKTVSKGKIVKPDFSDKLFTIKIKNPNYYARKLTFFNKNNETESIIIGSRSNSEIQLPKGFYRFESVTTFTKYKAQESTFSLNSDKNIILTKDDFN